MQISVEQVAYKYLGDGAPGPLEKSAGTRNTGK